MRLKCAPRLCHLWPSPLSLLWVGTRTRTRLLRTRFGSRLDVAAQLSSRVASAVARVAQNEPPPQQMPRNSLPSASAPKPPRARVTPRPAKRGNARGLWGCNRCAVQPRHCRLEWNAWHSALVARQLDAAARDAGRCRGDWVLGRDGHNQCGQAVVVAAGWPERHSLPCARDGARRIERRFGHACLLTDARRIERTLSNLERRFERLLTLECARAPSKGMQQRPQLTPARLSQRRPRSHRIRRRRESRCPGRRCPGRRCPSCRVRIHRGPRDLAALHLARPRWRRG